ncbi:MAG: ATP-binding protein [Burkholderiaceae bacterium]|nr:ATP-binding protein [Burkholderiaceae bacterium]
MEPPAAPRLARLHQLLPGSLQSRLVTMVLAAMLCIWLATAAMTWRDVRHELDELLDGHLSQAAALLLLQSSRQLDWASQTPGASLELGDAPLLHRYAPRVTYQVFVDGRLLLRSANAPHAPMVALHSPFETGLRNVTLMSVPGRNMATPPRPTAWRIFATEDPNHRLHVLVGERHESRTEIVRVVLRSILLPMILALPLLALAVWFAIHRGVAPLRQIGDFLARRRPQTLYPIAMRNPPREMRPMLDALNDLFARIAELMESERRFTADAAHELRTPIAAIRTQAQVALGEADPGRRRHALLATLAGCDRAAHMVEQLLTLSRLEAGASPPMQPVDLHALAQQVLADLYPLALTRDQTLALEDEGPCQVSGNSALLSVLLRNLVDNAIRYSPDGATVQVRLGREADDTLRLEVADSGPGLSEAELARLGERFFRVPGSNQPGSGLGWSIVRRIVAVHRFELTVGRSPALGGLSVCLQCRTVNSPPGTAPTP